MKGLLKTRSCIVPSLTKDSKTLELKKIFEVGRLHFHQIDFKI